MCLYSVNQYETKYSLELVIITLTKAEKVVSEYKHFKPSSSHLTCWDPPSVKEYIVTKPLGYLIIRWKNPYLPYLTQHTWFNYRLYHDRKKHNHIFSWTVYCYAMDAYSFVELIARSDFWWVTLTLGTITVLEAASHKQQLSTEASWCLESYPFCKSVFYLIILWDDSIFGKKTKKQKTPTPLSPPKKNQTKKPTTTTN